MLARSQPILVRMSGPLALFTRPEMKVERVSYDVITPSAARGILEAVLWKPGMRWVVQRITVLNPIRFLSVKRNEVQHKISVKDAKSWVSGRSAPRPLFADSTREQHGEEVRSQRNAILLRDVAYVVEAVIELTPTAGPDDSIAKFVAMFRRRVEGGQHFHQPYLGCREFPATVLLADGTEHPHEELLGKEADLGWMLHDIEYGDQASREPRFFAARIKAGVIQVPQPSEGVPR